MKHQDLVERLAERTKYTKREARDFIAALSDIIVDELLNGRDVQILGLGWFRNVRRGGGRGGIGGQERGLSSRHPGE